MSFMPKLNLKPTHKAIRDYYAILQQYEQHDIAHEGAVSSPFETLLHACAKADKRHARSPISNAHPTRESHRY